MSCCKANSCDMQDHEQAQLMLEAVLTKAQVKGELSPNLKYPTEIENSSSGSKA